MKGKQVQVTITDKDSNIMSVCSICITDIRVDKMKGVDVHHSLADLLGMKYAATDTVTSNFYEVIG